MSCWPECLLLNSATSGCMCSGFDFCLDPNFLTQPTVSCCAHAFPCLLFFASFLIFRLLPPPFHSISSTKAEKASRAQKKSGDSAESWFHAGRLSRLRRRRSAWRHLENLLPSTAKFRSKCWAFAYSWIFYFESNDNRVNCNVGSCSRRFS